MSQAMSHGPISAECPACGKFSIVEKNPKEYQCLNCDFSKDLAKKSKEVTKGESGWLNWILMLMVGLGMLALL